MNQYQLTWWELEELIEHMQDRNDLYEFQSPNMVLCLRMERDSRDMFPWYGIAWASPKPGKYSITTVHISQLDERYKPDFMTLLVEWTSFGIRYQMTEALRDSLKLEERTATAMGIGLAHIALVGEHSELYKVAGVQSDKMPKLHRLLHVMGGGYVSLEPAHRGLMARISVPSVIGGFSGELRGYVNGPSGCDYAVFVASRVGPWLYDDSGEPQAPWLPYIERIRFQSRAVGSGYGEGGGGGNAGDLRDTEAGNPRQSPSEGPHPNCGMESTQPSGEAS